MKQYEKMTQTPVNRLVASLAVPTVISMLITTIYNVTDTYFVSKINVSASGATGVVFSLMAIIQAFGFMFGHGSGSCISRHLGAKKLDEAGLKVDYIITHEPPSLVKSAILLRRGDNDRINKLNGYLEEIGRSCEFKHWYFGSLHEDRVITVRHTCVFKEMIPIKQSADKPRGGLKKSHDQSENDLFVLNT